MEETLVFVYGSLRSGLRNHYMLDNSQYLGDFTSEEYFHLIAYETLLFPYLLNLPITNAKTQIKGEIYKVNNQVLKKLDILESHPDLYQRQEKIFTNGEETVSAYVYILANTTIVDSILDNLNSTYFLIESGDWVNFLCTGK